MLLLCQLSLLLAQQVFLEQRVLPSEFVVMSWGPAPSDPQQIRWMKDAGINGAGFAEVKDLAVLERGGVQVFVSDPRINGYNFERPLDPEVVWRNVQDGAREVGSRPAVIGFLLPDEPQVKIVSGLGLMAKKIQETMPGKLLSAYSGKEENSTDEMDWVAPGAGHLFKIE